MKYWNSIIIAHDRPPHSISVQKMFAESLSENIHGKFYKIVIRKSIQLQ